MASVTNCTLMVCQQQWCSETQLQAICPSHTRLTFQLAIATLTAKGKSLSSTIISTWRLCITQLAQTKHKLSALLWRQDLCSMETHCNLKLLALMFSWWSLIRTSHGLTLTRLWRLKWRGHTEWTITMRLRTRRSTGCNLESHLVWLVLLLSFSSPWYTVESALTSWSCQTRQCRELSAERQEYKVQAECKLIQAQDHRLKEQSQLSAGRSFTVKYLDHRLTQQFTRAWSVLEHRFSCLCTFYWMHALSSSPRIVWDQLYQQWCLSRLLFSASLMESWRWDCSNSSARLTGSSQQWSHR